jgi:hypothetical protein
MHAKNEIEYRKKPNVGEELITFVWLGGRIDDVA